MPLNVKSVPRVTAGTQRAVFGKGFGRMTDEDGSIVFGERTGDGGGMMSPLIERCSVRSRTCQCTRAGFDEGKSINIIAPNPKPAAPSSIMPHNHRRTLSLYDAYSAPKSEDSVRSSGLIWNSVMYTTNTGTKSTANQVDK
jgi:hypothetical protein